MAGTAYSEIYDLFLVSVRDYKIDQLYDASPVSMEAYLEGFLIKSIPVFDNCAQDLEDRDDDDQEFGITLTTFEKVILSNIMAYQWLMKEIQDVTQMNLHLQTDFKHYAESQNLKEKSEYANRAREIYMQDMVQYGLKNVDWTGWAGGVYG